MKNKATPKEQPQTQQPYDTPSHIQRARILAALKEAGSDGRSTIQLREQLDVLHPAGRIMELREEGLRIDTVWTVTENAQGYKHRNARYVLVREVHHV